MNEDPRFGAVFINYFGYRSNENLYTIIKSRAISKTAYMHYINNLMMNSEKIQSKKLIDTGDKVIISVTYFFIY